MYVLNKFSVNVAIFIFDSMYIRFEVLSSVELCLVHFLSTHVKDSLSTLSYTCVLL